MIATMLLTLSANMVIVTTDRKRPMSANHNYNHSGTVFGDLGGHQIGMRNGLSQSREDYKKEN